MASSVREVLFFNAPGGSLPLDDFAAPSPSAEQLDVWQPTLASLRPRGLALLPYAFWWLAHYLRLFRNRRYSVFVLRDGDAIVHRSCVFPPYLRFPFMKPRDVQVGDVWTAADRRGRGLSVATLRRILALHTDTDVWFLCDADNAASIALATRVGMKLYGIGTREPRFGVAFLGRYVIRSRASK
jgi:RimJ/RimL family protein N-acetyltransferase